MYKIIDYEGIEIDKINDTHILIDLRSPKEHKAESIPCSINIPIFNDEERALIGTIYKQESIEKAKKIGIEIGSRRLPSLYEEISQFHREHKELVFYCARGGFRSSSVVSLLKSLGINAVKLENGYKGYRKHVNEQLPIIVSEIKFVVIYGNTGTGKTDILNELKAEGIDILDLEGCANHRGSILGSVGLGEQNTQKMFESLVYESLQNRKTNLVFIEGESKRIGKDIIPDYLFDAMNNGINIRIEASIEKRIDNLFKDYVHDTDMELISSLDHLRKYLGDTNIDRYIQLIAEHNYKPVIEDLITKYYDPLYGHKNRTYEEVFLNDDASTTARNIILWAKKLNL